MFDIPAPRLELNQLLRDIPANRDRIYLAMYDLAVCKAKRIHFKNVQDREDTVSESVMYVMTRLHKYNSQRHAACAYFGRMLHRQMMRSARKIQARYMTHDAASLSRGDSTVLDSAPAQHLPRRTTGRWRDAQVRDKQDRDRVKDVLDEALDKACKFTQAYGVGDHVDGPQLAIGVLQHIRKALLGRFNRIQADHQLAPAPINEGSHEA